LTAFHPFVVESLDYQEPAVWKHLAIVVDEYSLHVSLSLKPDYWQSKNSDHGEGDVVDAANLAGFVRETKHGAPSQIWRHATLLQPQMLKEASL
jgi:hypothetical protein